MNAKQIVCKLLLLVILAGANLVWASCHAARADEGGKKEPPTVVVEEDWFRDVQRAMPKAGQKVKVGKNKDLVGHVEQNKGSKTVVLEHPAMKVAPGKKQRFEFHSAAEGYQWSCKDPKLAPDVTKKTEVPVTRSEEKPVYGKATQDRVFEYEGRKGKVTLEFEYKRPKQKPAFVYKVEIEG
jgi:hypothetical protein